VNITVRIAGIDQLTATLTRAATAAALAAIHNTPAGTAATPPFASAPSPKQAVAPSPKRKPAP
jgi:hypothetical protein